jgi:DNA-binding NarL/FixJ family response regulator
VLSDDPVSVAAALRACLDGWVLFCERALELANSLPPLSSEQQELLRFIAKGSSRKEMVRALNRSMSSVRREIPRLECVLGVAGLDSLRQRAADLGF